MNKLTILELPSNLGLKAPSPTHEPGVKKLPAHLRKHHFHDRLKPATVYRLDPPAYSRQVDEVSGVLNADQIRQYAQQQAALLKEVLAKNEFLVVLGGDCSILIGNALALRQSGRYGLFFLDGHTDFIMPALSQTAGAAGMELAIVAGHGAAKLTDIAHQKPYFSEETIWCIGNRDDDPGYVKPIEDSAIEYKNLSRLRALGLQRCVREFLDMVHSTNLDGFWIHLDVDVLDDKLMPAVDSRQPDGLNYAELNELLYGLLTSEKSTGLEITILDPDLDPTGEYTKGFVANFCQVFTLARG